LSTLMRRMGTCSTFTSSIATIMSSTCTQYWLYFFTASFTTRRTRPPAPNTGFMYIYVYMYIYIYIGAPTNISIHTHTHTYTHTPAPNTGFTTLLLALRHDVLSLDAFRRFILFYFGAYVIFIDMLYIIYMCVYAYMYVCMYICIYIYICIYVYVCMYVRMYVCIYILYIYIYSNNHVMHLNLAASARSSTLHQRARTQFTCFTSTEVRILASGCR
jgi:hypothetical protein